MDGSTSRHLKRIILRPSEKGSYDPDTPFVAFESVPRRREIDDTPDYRRMNEPEVEDDGEEDILSGLSTFEDDVRKRTADYERYLQLNPTDIDSWIAYSKLHLELDPGPSRKRSGLSSSTSHASAEVTLSILTRALDTLYGRDHKFTSPDLHIAHIKAAQIVWPASKVTARWLEVIRELQTGKLDFDAMPIWLGYLDWCEGQGFGKPADGEESGGGVDGIVAVYEEALKTAGQSMRESRKHRVEWKMS